MISDICPRRPTDIEKTKLFFEAVRGEPRMDIANRMLQVENGEAGVLISELLNGKPIVESYTPAIDLFVEPDVPIIRTANGGEYVCQTANPSIASEKFAVCESIAWRIGLLCGYLEGEKGSIIAQKLQDLADLEPIRNEIVEWFLLSARIIPFDDELRLIVRRLIADQLNSDHGLTPSYVAKKLDGTVSGAEKYKMMRGGEEGKKERPFSIIMFDAEHPERIGTIEYEDPDADDEPDISKQLADFMSKLESMGFQLQDYINV